MPNRIEARFEELKERKQKALIPFITAGHPNLEMSEALVLALEQAGADLIELGVPFSDPMADGPVIQAASEHALAQGVTLRKVLKLVEKIRKKSDIPIILMGYANPIYAMGYEAFAAAARKAQVDGVLVVDLPPEEAGPLKMALQAEEIPLIFLLAPTSSFSRVKAVQKLASGFVYYVSLTGVTGAKLVFDASLKRQIEDTRAALALPLCVGFGISTPAQAKTVAASADGVVVGSALVKLISGVKSKAQVMKKASQFIGSLRKAIA